jgi:hypothetical protein
MPRTCSICGHPKRTEIDSALLRSDTLRSIIASFSVSNGALMRHRERHLPVTLAHAREVRETEMGEDLMGQATKLRARAFGILEAAEKAGQLDTALKAIRELRGILELLGKLDGQLAERATTVQRIEVHYVDKQLVMQGANVHPTKCIPGGES